MHDDGTNRPTGPTIAEAIRTAARFAPIEEPLPADLPIGPAPPDSPQAKAARAIAARIISGSERP